ncbi:MAG TPA: hypothetical protein VHW09_21185 [Bryobacteraceae bacterium]|nr:hypothetical protein [Bryobacteraceae bacterium]
MADFRKWLTVLAVVAVMACTASAQVGVANGSANSLLACVATAAGTPELRPEGYTELAGDIVISCTGGPVLQQGANIPTTNIVVYMAPSVPITSRFLSSNGASEALLIIDEAGSAITTGVAGNFGPKAPQVLCTTAQQQQTGGSACNVTVGMDPGTAGGPYEVPVPTNSAFASAPNVFQGKVGDFGVNSVTFYNVPVLPPATSGVTRTFRITNIRVPVPGGNLSGTLQAIISTSPNQTLPVAGTAINIGVVGPAMTASVSQNPAGGFQQCQPETRALTANIYFTEGFATGFKTRVVPGGIYNGVPGNAAGNTTYAAEGTNTSPAIQNIPGGLYGGFAANSESGLIMPSLGGGGFTAGLADYGTRLKAVFTNIPAGLTMYVSTTSATQGTNFIVGGTSVLPFAVLVATNSGEATPDGTPFTPITSSVNGSDGLPAIALSANSSGVATAVWEVTNSNPSATDVLKFSVYISYTATSATATNPYGLPITVLPLGAPVNNVALSFAPEPGGGTFATTNATQGQAPTPRFAIVKTQQGAWTSIGLCQTTLLYPFVTGASGFDTGIAVANTTWDPFGTVHQTGSCTLYGYGVTVASAGNTAIQTQVPGCDAISNPLPGTNCFPIVPTGQVGTVLASATLTNFQGYVIAICNFQLAHGYAAVTDLGIRNLWSSYLALELAPAGTVAGGSPRTGVQSIEVLAH